MTPVTRSSYHRAERDPTSSGLGLEVVRVVRERLAAGLGHEDDVLESHAAVPSAIEPGLDGDDVARDERLLRQQSHAGLLVHLEADAVAEPVEEPVDERLARGLRPLRGLAR